MHRVFAVIVKGEKYKEKFKLIKMETRMSNVCYFARTETSFPSIVISIATPSGVVVEKTFS